MWKGDSAARLAVQVGPILTELDEDVVDVHIAMLKTDERIDESRPSP